MPKPAEIYREACGRFHNALAHYFALWCWKEKVDCVILNREQIESLFEMGVFKTKRLRQFRADIAPWFPFFEDMRRVGSKTTSAFFLSRFEIPKEVKRLSGSPDDFAGWLCVYNVKAKTFPAFPKQESNRLSENEIIQAMTLIAVGSYTASDLPYVSE